MKEQVLTIFCQILTPLKKLFWVSCMICISVSVAWHPSVWGHHLWSVPGGDPTHPWLWCLGKGTGGKPAQAASAGCALVHWENHSGRGCVKQLEDPCECKCLKLCYWKSFSFQKLILKFAINLVVTAAPFDDFMLFAYEDKSICWFAISFSVWSSIWTKPSCNELIQKSSKRVDLVCLLKTFSSQFFLMKS